MENLTDKRRNCYMLKTGNRTNQRRVHLRQLFLIYFVLLGQQGFLFLSARQVEAKVVRDQAGRTVSVPDNAQRVIALAPSITETVFCLGREDRLKGVTEYSNFPPAARDLPRVGSYKHPDLEKIVALQPDLCLAIKDGNPKDLAVQLEALHIPVYAVNPLDLKGVMNTILAIGDLLGAQPKAEQLVDEMSARIERIKSRVALAKEHPRVFFQIGISPMVSVGTHTFANELISEAGGENITEGPVPYPRVSREEVLLLKPEVIIITSMTRGEEFERIRNEWYQWPSLPAVRNQRIFIVDSNLFDRPTFRLVEGLELLARCIHPELFQGS